MGKSKENLILRAKKLIGNSKSFEVQSKSTDVLIFCKSCTASFKIDDVHLNTQYQSHLKSQKHKKATEKNILQPSIFGAVANTTAKNSKDDSYSLKLAKTFLEAGIPIYKLRHPSIKKFFLEEHKEVLPCVNTFYGKIDVIYQNTLQKIKDYIGEHPIYFIIDETTDACSRFVLNVIVGKLDGTPSKPVLLSTIFLERTNNTTVQQAVNKACAILYGSEIPYEKVWFLITDQAPYMLKAGRGLKEMFPNLKHLTCLIHGLNRVCDLIKENNDVVNKFIASMKAVLSKSNERRKQYHELCNLPLPPDVIEIRWNTWLNAAFFYAEHFSVIKNFAIALEEKDSKIISKLKKAISNQYLEPSLYEVHKFKFLTEAITRLEKQGMTVTEQWAILTSVKGKLNDVYLEKLDKVLMKNPDLNFFEKMPVDQKIKCEHTPMVSVEAERSFSQYKYVLSDRRHSLTESHIAMLNIIQFNNFIDGETEKEN